MAVVLGLGCIAAPGIGSDALSSVPQKGGSRCVRGLDEAVDALGLRGVRPIARVTRLACVAAAAALGRPVPLAAAPDRCAVVLGTRFASIEPLVEFNRSAALNGPALVSPSSFPNVVVNAHAGYLGILFGLAGPNVTLCGADAGLEALAYALDLLELGRADLVLAGGVEALGETLTEGLRRSGVSDPGEGAAFVLLAASGAGPSLEYTKPGEPTEGSSWSGADIVPTAGDCGAAGGVLATILALRATEAGRGPQRVRGGRDTLTVRPS
jgi:hypothetical protein